MQEAAVRLGWRWLQRQLCSRKGRSHSMMRMLGWGRLSYLSSLWAWTDDDDLSILFLFFLSLPRCSSSCFHHKIYSANLPLFLSHFLAVLLTFLRLLLSSLCSLLPSAFTAHGEADCFPKLDGAFLPSSCLDFQVTRLHNMDPMLCQAVEGWCGGVGRGCFSAGHFLQTLLSSPVSLSVPIPWVLSPGLFNSCSTGASTTRQPVQLLL